jgi:hypothetical protein
MLGLKGNGNATILTSARNARVCEQLMTGNELSVPLSRKLLDEVACQLIRTGSVQQIGIIETNADHGSTSIRIR